MFDHRQHSPPQLTKRSLAKSESVLERKTSTRRSNLRNSGQSKIQMPQLARSGLRVPACCVLTAACLLTSPPAPKVLFALNAGQQSRQRFSSILHLSRKLLGKTRKRSKLSCSLVIASAAQNYCCLLVAFVHELFST